MVALDKIVKLATKHEFGSAFIGLLVLMLAVYWRAFGYGFIWDNFTHIVNSDVLASPSGFFRLWTTHSTADFWPLSYSLFWIQKQLYGNDPIGFHSVNLALFFLSGLLIFKLLKKLNVKAAFFIAAIYIVHPMNVEASVWVFQAKTNLANMFGLLSIKGMDLKLKSKVPFN